MSNRLRLSYLSLAALGLVAAWALGAGERSQAAVSPTMTGYIMDGDLLSGLAFADGTEVGATDFPYPVIPPGTYQITINDTAQTQGFTLTGIGVSQSTGPSDRGTVTWTVTFLPCVLYGYNSGRRFQTSASPTDTTACTRLDTQVTATTPTTVATTPTAVLTSGSGPGGKLSALGTPIAAPLRGALHATVTSSGKLELTLAGKPVTRLTAGRYRLTVVDKARRAGLSLNRAGASPLVVTGARFVGTRRTTLALAVGRWTFSPGAASAAPAVRFTVSG